MVEATANRANELLGNLSDLLGDLLDTLACASHELAANTEIKDAVLEDSTLESTLLAELSSTNLLALLPLADTELDNTAEFDLAEQTSNSLDSGLTLAETSDLLGKGASEVDVGIQVEVILVDNVVVTNEASTVGGQDFILVVLESLDGTTVLQEDSLSDSNGLLNVVHLEGTILGIKGDNINTVNTDGNSSVDRSASPLGSVVLARVDFEDTISSLGQEVVSRGILIKVLSFNRLEVRISSRPANSVRKRLLIDLLLQAPSVDGETNTLESHDLSSRAVLGSDNLVSGLSYNSVAGLNLSALEGLSSLLVASLDLAALNLGNALASTTAANDGYFTAAAYLNYAALGANYFASTLSNRGATTASLDDGAVLKTEDSAPESGWSSFSVEGEASNRKKK
jgi:hypothetical protein